MVVYVVSTTETLVMEDYCPVIYITPGRQGHPGQPDHPGQPSRHGRPGPPSHHISSRGPSVSPFRDFFNPTEPIDQTGPEGVETYWSLTDFIVILTWMKPDFYGPENVHCDKCCAS